MGQQFLGPAFERFLDDVRAAAADTDRSGRLPRRFHDELRRVGFGRIRLAPGDGGLGASVVELLETVRDIAAADPNLAQSWRTHVLATERHLKEADGPTRRRWLARIASGVMIGGGWTESDGSSGSQFTTRLHRRADGTLALDGTKYYSTGSTYADWLEYSAVDDSSGLVIAAVPADAPGVHVLDDWTGFGQRATGSGTTELRDVDVDPADVAAFGTQHRGTAGWQQIVLLAVLTGITKDAARTARELIDESERRNGPADVRVLERYGRLEALAFGTDAALLRAAGAADRAHVALVETPGSAADAIADAAEVSSFRAQVLIVPEAVEAGRVLLEVAAMLPEPTEDLRRRWALDRYWRNARTIAQHNPVLHRARTIADRLLHDIGPDVGVDDRGDARAAAVGAASEARGLDAVRLGGDLADALAEDRTLRGQFAAVLAEHAPVLLVLEDEPGHGDPSVAAAAVLGDVPRAWIAVTTRIDAIGHPYDHARRIASLDQLSGGRVAWFLRVGADQDPTDVVTVVQQLWRSWPRETLALDGRAPAFAETTSISRINATGTYRVTGPLNVPSSPQGLPVTITSGCAARAEPTSHVDLVEALGGLVLTDGFAGLPAIVRMSSVVHHDVESVDAALTALAAPADADGAAAPVEPFPTLRQRLGLRAPLLDPLPGAVPRFGDLPEAS